MEKFHALRAAHQYTQTNLASPEEIFPLLCPVREAEWVPGWQFRLIFSNSGYAEENCIFRTPNGDGTETIWTITEYDPANFRIAFVWIYPNHVVCRIKIALSRRPDGNTRADIGYVYTALSEAGNHDVKHYDSVSFQNKMRGWEAAINHYLATGTRIAVDPEE